MIAESSWRPRPTRVVTDLSAAALVEIAEGDAEPKPRIEALTDTLRATQSTYADRANACR